MPKPVSLAYPAAIKLPFHGFSFGPCLDLGAPMAAVKLTLYAGPERAHETISEVVFTDIVRALLDNPPFVVCPACLVHRHALVAMKNVSYVRSQCPECKGILDGRIHGETAAVSCFCGQIPHDRDCPMFPRSF